MANENAQPEPIQITFAKGTDVGRKRDHNEDHVDAFSPPDPTQRRQKGQLFIVADGMGGHQAGDVASQSAVRVLSREYYADPDSDVRGSLIRAIKQANAYIHEQAQQMVTRAGMGTTVVAAVVRGPELYLANVGDSRAYLMRQGKISQATQDHSFVAEQVRAGILSVEEARVHPQRNVITRALGSKPEVKVDTYRGELQPGDILLLCSDGLSEYVHEEDMLALLSQYSPDEAIPRLIAMANKRGGSDNISVLVVQAVPPANVVTTEKAVPTVPSAPSPAPASKKTPLPLIAGIAAIVLIGGAILVAVLIFVAPRLGDKTTPTPTPTVTPTATSTLAPTSPPTSTPQFTEIAPTEGAPTATPLTAFSLEQPPDGATVRPGMVTFSWRSIGQTGQIAFAVKSDAGELCNVEKDSSCQADLQEGAYNWWVEILVDGQTLLKSDPRTLHVRLPSPPTSTYTPMPVPTFTLTPAPTTQPPSGDGNGGGNGGDGDGDPPPSR